MAMKYTLSIGAKLHSPKRTYTVEKVLGQGGFGITYKVSANLQVENVTIRTYFAVKEFFMSDACERNENDSICYSSPVKDKVEESRKDFLAEAQRLNKISLEHPNIIHVNEVFEANNTVYYVMEYLDAGSLRSYVREHGALSENEALAIMMPIMNAVDYLHQHRMTHLDIKPDNVMLKHDPDTGEIIPVLIDFGLSKHYDKNGKPTSTMRASGFSDGYAPVEQYTGIYTFSPQADVYALAATLYYALVGKDPVIATELSEEKIRAALNGKSNHVVSAIVEAMRMHKGERTLSVRKMMQTLDGVSSGPLNKTKQVEVHNTKIIRNNRCKKLLKNFIDKMVLIRNNLLSFGCESDIIVPERQTSLYSTLSNNSVKASFSWSCLGDFADSSLSLENNILSIHVTNGVNIEMVKVEAGTFMMGATFEMESPWEDEKPVRQVTLARDYYMGKYEVTQVLWQAVMGSNHSYFKGDNLPVERVSWNDCQEFIGKLNGMTGRKFRLPTEAEWEYAARGGKKSRGYQYSGNSQISDVAWYDGNSGLKTHPVGTKHANELGLYDMAGNVWEWCQDWYGSYSSSSQANSIINTGGSSRVYRGGSWFNVALCCRSSVRCNGPQDANYCYVGLRLALSE